MKIRGLAEASQRYQGNDVWYRCDADISLVKQSEETADREMSDDGRHSVVSVRRFVDGEVKEGKIRKRAK